MEEYYEQDNKIVRSYTKMFVTELEADDYYRPEEVWTYNELREYMLKFVTVLQFR